jgi:pSer/pThr/pTyr-binding forkhead associated (FHA) protein
MSFRLLVHHPSACDEVPLPKFPIVLGRGPNAAIRLGDRWVSGCHCELDLVDGELVIRDLGAKHGTYVNGQPVAERQLRVGDEIRVGLTVLTVAS